MRNTTRSTVILTTAVLALGITSCGPSQEEKDKEAASTVAVSFTEASPIDQCQYEADNLTEADINQCREVRSSYGAEADQTEWEVKAVEPWGNGYAVQLEGSHIEVVGLLNIDNSWKVSEYDSTDKEVVAQSDWVCQVIGGPECGSNP